MKTLAYLVYGTKREYQLELTYSVLSARHFIGRRSDYRIVLISDGAVRRDDLPVEQLVFSPDDLARWTLDGRYPHLAKPGALRLTLDRYAGPVALIDTDTYFLRHPDELFDRIASDRSVMHAVERPLGEHPEWRPLLERISRSSAGYPILSESTMYNSGVVGIDSTRAALVDEAIELMKELHATVQLFNIEQFAFTAVLGRHTALTVCPEVVQHYWGWTRGFVHTHIASLFPTFSKDTFDRLVASPPTLRSPEKRLVDQVRSRLKAWQRRQDGAYRFAYLAYLSALSNAKRDAPVANAWAALALVFLRTHQIPRNQARQDFAALLRPDRQRWLTDEARRGWIDYWRDGAAGEH